MDPFDVAKQCFFDAAKATDEKKIDQGTAAYYRGLAALSQGLQQNLYRIQQDTKEVSSALGRIGTTLNNKLK